MKPLIYYEAVTSGGQELFGQNIGKCIGECIIELLRSVKPRGIIGGGAWQFSVTDNGPGIDLRYYERIFQIFQTLKPRDEMESTGIGLTIVRKIVEQYGGKFGRNPRQGKEARFY